VTHDELIMKFQDGADWRRQKCEEYPDDPRNEKAVALLERLAKTAIDVPPHLLNAYDDTFFRSDDMSGVIDLESYMLRAVGFWLHPTDAAEFLHEFLAMARPADGEYQPKLVR
jgi:hypothetical protein